MAFARISFDHVERLLTIHVTGCAGGQQWWYRVTPSGTFVSRDNGRSFDPVDHGWSFPERDWMMNGAEFVGNYGEFLLDQDRKWKYSYAL